MEIATKKDEGIWFCWVRPPKKKIIINDGTLQQVSKFTYLGSSMSYKFSNDVEFKLTNFFTINYNYN